MEQALKYQVSVNQLVNILLLIAFLVDSGIKKGEPRAKKGERKMGKVAFFHACFCSIFQKVEQKPKKHNLLKYRIFCRLLKETL